MAMSGEVVKLKVDSKSLCLLCLKDCQFKNTGTESYQVTSTATCLELLRYLKIEVIRDSSSVSVSQAVNGLELAVTLCDGCTSISDHLLKLHQQLEMLQLQLEKGSRQMSEVIKSSNTNIGRMEAFRRRFPADVPDELEQRHVLEELRMKMELETMGKYEKASPVSPPSAKELGRNEGDKKTVNQEVSLDRIIIKTEPETLDLSNDEEDDDLVTYSNGGMCLSQEENGEGTDSIPIIAGTHFIGSDQDQNNEDDSNIMEIELGDQPSNSNNSNYFSCTNCGKPCFSNSQLIRHEKSCQGHFFCNYCGWRSTASSTCRNHIVTEHPLEYFRERLPPFTTRESFNTAVDLVLEECDSSVTCDGRVLKSCTHCSKGYTVLKTLKSHILKHHLEKVIEKLRDVHSGQCVATSQLMRKAEDEDSLVERGQTSSTRLSRDPNGGWNSSAKGSIQRKKKEKTCHFKCQVCGLESTATSLHNLHMLRKHAAFTLANKLPLGTTEEQLNQAVYPLHTRRCRICKKTFAHGGFARVHLLTDHLNVILGRLQSNKELLEEPLEVDGVHPEENHLEHPTTADYEGVAANE